MTKAELKKELLNIIEDDFYENLFDWKEYLIQSEIERLRDETPEILVDFLSDDMEQVANMLEIEVEELEELLKTEEQK